MDASVLVTALADDGPDGERVRRRLAGERLAAPHLVDIEVVSAWRRLAAAGLLDDRRAAMARTDLRDLPIRRVAHAAVVERCWSLRSTLTVYEAAYVALAELLDVVMVTADTKLATAPGPTCRIEVV